MVLHIRTGRGSGDGGQATVLMVFVVAVTIGIALVLTQLGAVAVDRARARTAADAAALAGAAEGEDAAARVAERNGGVLESFGVLDGQTEVTVRVGRARATSRAALTPAPVRAAGLQPTVTRVGSREERVIPYTFGNVLDRATAQPFTRRFRALER